MDKFEQIGKLSDAYALIREVISECDLQFHTELESIADNIANIADKIENA